MNLEASLLYSQLINTIRRSFTGKRGFGTYLLSEFHDLESLEIREVPPLLHLLSLLGERGLSPLAVDFGFGPQFANGTRTSGERKLGDEEAGKGDVREGSDVTGNDVLLITGGTIDENL